MEIIRHIRLWLRYWSGLISFIPVRYLIISSGIRPKISICRFGVTGQYDILYGDRYVYEESERPLQKASTVNGGKDTSITNLIEQIDGSCSVYGENFTKQKRSILTGAEQEK